MLKSFIMKSLLNVRVKALLQELKWDLEASEPDRIAAILLISQSLRVELFEPDAEARALIDNPFKRPRADVVSFYRSIEQSRNQVRAHNAYLLRQVKALGSPPELTNIFDKEHAELAERANEVWMATLGSAITNNGLNYGIDIWTMLYRSIKHVPAAVTDFKRREQASGQPIVGQLTIGEAQNICGYVPSVIAEQLRLR